MVELNRDEIIQKATNAGALLDLEDKEKLYELGMFFIKRGGIAIEVGSWSGGSAVILGSICQSKGAHLYCIDSFSHDLIKYGQLTDTERLLRFIENTRGLPISILSGDSAEVHKLIRDGCADLVFIDGDHHYENVKADLANYIRKLERFGVICGHDYGGTTPEVTQAVDEFFGKGNVIWSKKYLFWGFRPE